jgi:hypothetical protein
MIFSIHLPMATSGLDYLVLGLGGFCFFVGLSAAVVWLSSIINRNVQP